MRTMSDNIVNKEDLENRINEANRVQNLYIKNAHKAAKWALGFSYLSMILSCVAIYLSIR